MSFSPYEMRPIFACTLCGAQRVLGDETLEAPRNKQPYLMCDERCVPQLVQHEFMGLARTLVTVVRLESSSTVGALARVGFIFEKIVKRAATGVQ